MSNAEITPGTVVTPDSWRSGIRRSWIIIAVVVVVAAVAIIGVIALKRGRSSSARRSLTLEPAGTAGANPFTDSVAIGPAASFPANVSAILTTLRSKLPTAKSTRTLVAVGTAPGVYGGNGATPVCASQALVTYLKQNPGNATAWARTSGIAPSNIATFVATLTPVVLMNDTRVTNHAYDHAAAAPRQSVLQAGTAVLVDTTGTPRVICKSGNPLTPTRPIVITKTKGAAWSGYSPKKIITIKPGPATSALTLVNIQTGEYYQQPSGAGSAAPAGSPAGYVIAQVAYAGTVVQQTVLFTLRTGQPWTATASFAGETVSGLAWGAGKWVAVTKAENGGTGNKVLESTDLHAWKQVAALPDQLSGIAYGNGRWMATAVHSTPAPGPLGTPHAATVIYTSTDATHWSQVAAIGRIANGSTPTVHYGNGEWLIVVGTPVPGSATPSDSTLVMFASQDGLHWASNRGHIRGQRNPALAFRYGKWVLGSTPVGGGTAVVNTSTNGVSWRPSSAGLPNGGIAAITSGPGAWMAAVTGGPGQPVSTVVTSLDTLAWTPVGNFQAYVSAIAFGGTFSTKTPASTAPTAAG